MDKNNPKTYLVLVKTLGQLLSISRLYKFEHPVFKKSLRPVFTEVNEFIKENDSLNFFQSGSILLVNGEEIEIKDSLVAEFTKSFHNLQLGSLSFEYGITVEEFEVFMRILYQEETLQGEDKIKQYLNAKGVKHIIPRAATYKMVQEDEVIVKNGGILNIDEIPNEILDKFVQDLKNAKVSEKLVHEETNYKFVAHNPVFLSETVFNLIKDKEEPEELSKILWAMGDYLIDEIDTVNKEELNRKILDDIKKNLFSVFEQKLNKEHLKNEIQKIFIAINTALQLKGLILVFEKHKNSIVKIEKRIKKILELLPQDSQLYQKTKEKLEKIGSDIFNKD